MRWNWQHPNWPNFTWSPDRLAPAERLFAQESGILIGTSRHIDDADRETLLVEQLCLEATDTSAIEGEMLDRDSVQSSIRRQLGLVADRRQVGAAEAGIAELMSHLYQTLSSPLDHADIQNWHRMLMNGRRDLDGIGRYRTHQKPMQIVSGAIYAPTVYYEAPPSERVPAEMARFLTWFADTAAEAGQPLPPMTRAGIAHLWFESIHPFEDGNGRLGRAIAEKALAQGVRPPILTGLSTTLLKHRKTYYAALHAASKTLEITQWLEWFANKAIEARRRSIALLEFTLAKARLFDRIGDQLNERQRKAVLRLFAAGPDGFVGGLSAGKYRSITGATPPTATRDLADLVALGVLRRTGERKSTRYSLNLPNDSSIRVSG
ncbi:MULTISPECIES: Fic family protein [Thiorhodovibrio]|uniref:Fic family protein n=1 Tax=Thiorhodovibrio TaxID=61593 RepID=UPI001913EC5F|nr:MULTISPECIES: Fic family protein [Thiorhodovibrio]MBK5968357.1 cell filamentation protein Fic [Thiorhodovibrio winogradskyi]WPL13194.1 Adenosine monophosphate-protein transferase SoFic [Thiorhodovibrio litoralis]